MTKHTKTIRTTLMAELTAKLEHGPSIVLVVDDDPCMRKLVKKRIQGVDPSIEVIEAANGMQGVAAVKNIRRQTARDPLFIVLDLCMPIVSGWQVIQELRRDYESRGKTSGPPIIVLSSSSGEAECTEELHSVHDQQTGYFPLITLAKEDCIRRHAYDAPQEAGLAMWLRYLCGTAQKNSNIDN